MAPDLLVCAREMGSSSEFGIATTRSRNLSHSSKLFPTWTSFKFPSIFPARDSIAHR